MDTSETKLDEIIELDLKREIYIKISEQFPPVFGKSEIAEESTLEYQIYNVLKHNEFDDIVNYLIAPENVMDILCICIGSAVNDFTKYLRSFIDQNCLISLCEFKPLNYVLIDPRFSESNAETGNLYYQQYNDILMRELGKSYHDIVMVNNEKLFDNNIYKVSLIIHGTKCNIFYVGCSFFMGNIKTHVGETKLYKNKVDMFVKLIEHYLHKNKIVIVSNFIKFFVHVAPSRINTDYFFDSTELHIYDIIKKHFITYKNLVLIDFDYSKNLYKLIYPNSVYFKMRDIHKNYLNHEEFITPFEMSEDDRLIINVQFMPKENIDDLEPRNIFINSYDMTKSYYSIPLDYNAIIHDGDSYGAGVGAGSSVGGYRFKYNKYILKINKKSDFI
jgi:hypothetical protein